MLVSPMKPACLTWTERQLAISRSFVLEDLLLFVPWNGEFGACQVL
jgi:hypothetical protein